MDKETQEAALAGLKSGIKWAIVVSVVGYVWRKF